MVNRRMNEEEARRERHMRREGRTKSERKEMEGEERINEKDG